jgi:phospho-N-acetylmuramoyl-pentapeptide-transferase
MAGGTALLIGFVVAPLIIARLRKFKADQAFRDQSEVGKLADLHASKKGTPTMGGFIIFFAVFGSTLLWATPNVYVLTALWIYAGLTVIGFLDDYLKIKKKKSGGLSGRWKLVGQCFLSLVGISFLLFSAQSYDLIRELWVPFVKEPLWLVTPLFVLIPFFALVIVGSSNAINLTDGVDGLAIGCTVTVALAYGIIAYAAGNSIISDYLFIRFLPGVGELTVICSALVAGSLAFLWYNAHPAEVFMGDTGSLALGGLIGSIAFMTLHPFLLILIGGIFVMEAMSVILQVASFKSTGKRIFRMSPIHHHYELKGWKETQVVIRFWILSLIFALSGLATLKLR